MDVGILAPIIGVALAVVIVLVLRRVMRVRAAKTQPPAAVSALAESEREFLDSSHIGGPIVGNGADPRWKASGRSSPPRDRIP